MKTPNSIRCVIVEDEKAGQLILINKLQQLYPNFVIEAVIDNKDEAINYLQQNKIDILFLDAHIKGGIGLEIIETLNLWEQQKKTFNKTDKKIVFTYKMPNVMFITAYQQYALDALNLNASYYLLKPIREDKLKKGIDIILQRIAEKRLQDTPTSLLVSYRGQTINLQVNTILYFQSDGPYTYIHYDDQTVIATKNIGYYDDLLSEGFFVRCHNSFLVNINKIKQIIRDTKSFLLLSNDEKIPVSIRKYKDLLSKMQVG